TREAADARHAAEVEARETLRAREEEFLGKIAAIEGDLAATRRRGARLGATSRRPPACAGWPATCTPTPCTATAR
ncbi:MAG: hypothetical protein ACRDOO_25000, partial [Actinomadura sp.]